MVVSEDAPGSSSSSSSSDAAISAAVKGCGVVLLGDAAHCFPPDLGMTAWSFYTRLCTLWLLCVCFFLAMACVVLLAMACLARSYDADCPSVVFIALKQYAEV